MCCWTHRGKAQPSAEGSLSLHVSCKSFLRVKGGKGLGLAWGTCTCRCWVGDPADAGTGTPFPTKTATAPRLLKLCLVGWIDSIECFYANCFASVAQCFYTLGTAPSHVGTCSQRILRAAVARKRATTMAQRAFALPLVAADQPPFSWTRSRDHAL